MARTRDHAAEYRREVERAHRRGFSSPRQMRRAGRYPYDVASWRALSKDSRDARAEALSVIRQARRDDVPVEQLVRGRDAMSDLRYWAGDALGTTRSGKTYATEADELLRVRPLALDGDVTFVATTTSHQADLADHIFDVQWRYVNGRATQAELDRLPRTFQGQAVVRDGPELVRLGLGSRFAEIPETYAQMFDGGGS